MRCGTCRSEMTLLFFSYVCDRCDPPKQPPSAIDKFTEWAFKGFVHSVDPLNLPLFVSVFATETAARSHAAASSPGLSLPRAAVYEVLSRKPFSWTTQSGIVVATNTYHLHPADTYETGDYDIRLGDKKL